MAFPARKNRSTTQGFIEIEDIVEDVVIFPGGSACQIIEVMATNFALQSIEEQQVKILSYASLLNSLSFPIQIVILSRKLDISSYIKLLGEQESKTTNSNLIKHISHYKDFVADLVQNNVVLDKKFYITISFSFLEKGAGNIGSAKGKDAFIKDARNVLSGKTQSVAQELSRIGLKSQILQRNDLIRLFYEIYNHTEADLDFEESLISSFVQGKKIAKK